MPRARVVSACCRPKASYGVAPDGPAVSRSPALGDGGRRVGRIGPSVGIAKGRPHPAGRPSPPPGLNPRRARRGRRAPVRLGAGIGGCCGGAPSRDGAARRGSTASTSEPSTSARTYMIPRGDGPAAAESSLALCVAKASTSRAARRRPPPTSTAADCRLIRRGTEDGLLAPANRGQVGREPSPRILKVAATASAATAATMNRTALSGSRTSSRPMSPGN